MADNPLTNPQTDTTYQVAAHVHSDERSVDSATDDSTPMGREGKRDISPTALSNRLFTNLVSFSDVIVVPFVVANATSSAVTSTIADNYKRIILAVPQVSIYIGITNTSQILADGSNQWPTAAVGGGNFPVYFNPFDWGRSDDLNQVTRITCRNNTGSDQQVLAVIQWKMLTVPSSTPSNNTAIA